MASPPDESDTPRYAVVERPGPGLALIADRRTGAIALWSRSLRGGQGRHSLGRHTACANCGRDLLGPFYKLPEQKRAIPARLCLACVEASDG